MYIISGNTLFITLIHLKFVQVFNILSIRYYDIYRHYCYQLFDDVGSSVDIILIEIFQCNEIYQFVLYRCY